MKYEILPHISNMYNEFSNSNSRILIETGCHFGGRLLMAHDIGFKKMYSCDIFKDRVDHCINLSKENGFDLTCLHLNSEDFLKEVLPSINDRVLFWLDAHEEGGGQPLVKELDIISKHHINNHDIYIDDIPCYYTVDTRSELENKILSINPNYEIKYISSIQSDYILIARVP